MDSNVYKNFMDWHNLISDKKESKKDNFFKRELLVEVYKPEYNIDFGLPIARQVAARTVGLDLVSVQPLSAPAGLFFYMDSDFETENLYKRNILIEKMEKRRKSRRSRRRGNITGDNEFQKKTFNRKKREN
jgi:hypothetical protein